MEEFMIKNAATSLSKKDSIAISSGAWNDGIQNKTENMISGFIGSGISPFIPKNARTNATVSEWWNTVEESYS
jgi:hypothetical protein